MCVLKNYKKEIYCNKGKIFFLLNFHFTTRKILSCWKAFREEQQAGEGTRKQDVQGVAEGAGVV